MSYLRRSPLWLLGFLLLPSAGLAQGRGNDLLRSSPRFLGAFRPVVAKVSPGVVRVRCAGSDVALGVVVAADGWVLTKAHDLKGTLTCRLHDGRELDAKIVGVHAGHDLALLRVNGTGLTPIVLGESASAHAGNWVASAGLDELPIAVGIVSVATRDLAGKLELDPAQAPYLGVGLELADQGVRISEVLPATAALRAGLQTGDIILNVAGSPVRDPDAFIEELNRHRPGQTLTLRIARNGSEQDVRATLERRPSSPRVDVQNRMGSELSSRRAGYAIFLQHDTVLRPSDCGGPLVDLDGRVVGINICRAGRVETWAIPAEVARGLIDELKNGKSPPPAQTRTDLKPVERADALLAAINKRLLLMPEVARAKWNDGKPIHDPKRESALLDRLAAQAGGHDVSPTLARRFFTAQMAAARRLQENLFEQWKRTGAGEFDGVSDLHEVLRPAVEKASFELLAAFARLQPVLEQPEVQQRLRAGANENLAGEGVNDAVRQLALEPLLRR